MKNPVVEELAKKAMKEAANEQGGSVLEGTSRDPQRGDGSSKYTGHDSASSAGVGGNGGPGGS